MARKPRRRARPCTAPTTQIVLLGTGTPRPDPTRSGPATGLVVNGMPYLVDFGPGVVRRIAAAYDKGATAFGFAAAALQTVFLTHLHADHTAGYPDLILTPWILGRRQPLDVYGPKGLRSMTGHVLKAWEIDIEDRVTGIDRLPRRGCRVNPHEIAPGVIYVDRNIRVTAFPVRHGDLAALSAHPSHVVEATRGARDARPARLARPLSPLERGRRGEIAGCREAIAVGNAPALSGPDCCRT